MKNRTQKENDNYQFFRLMPLLLILLFCAICPSVFANNIEKEAGSYGMFLRWTCPKQFCGFMNLKEAKTCAVCGTKRPSSADMKACAHFESVGGSYVDAIALCDYLHFLEIVEITYNEVPERFDNEINERDLFHYRRGRLSAFREMIDELSL